MTPNPTLQGFINQARKEIDPNNALRHIFRYETVLLERLVHAIDTQSDSQLTATVFQMKAELDMAQCSIYTVLPALVNLLADELRNGPGR